MLYFESLIALFIYIIWSLILCFAILTVAYFISFLRPAVEKNTVYECGFKPFDYTYYPFDVQFYRTGILFLLFDVEIIFLFPWVLNFYEITIVGHLTVFTFIFLLIIGFVYEVRSEALVWYPANLVLQKESKL